MVVDMPCSREEWFRCFPWESVQTGTEKYWLSDRPQPKRRSVSRNLARFAVLTALVVGGSAVLSHYHVGHGASTYQGWTEE